MSWKEEYKKALADFVVRNGSWVRSDAEPYRSYGGYMARDGNELRAHMIECSVVSADVDDSQWEEFAGTFAEPQWQDRVGMDATITCACGRVQGRVLRYAGTFSEIVQGVLMEGDD